MIDCQILHYTYSFCVGNVIQVFIIVLDLKMKTNKIIGDFVKVNSPAYQQLRRAKIIDVKENSCFHVSYIDFGDSEVVHSRYIFELSTELNEKVTYNEEQNDCEAYNSSSLSKN